MNPIVTATSSCYLCNADGSNPVNLTKTKDVDEVYPKPSPDGTKICFVADEGKGDARVRNVYYMNSDGTGRTKVADNAREPCWSPDGTQIAFLKGEFEKFSYYDYSTRGLFIYDLKTGKTREHVNRKLLHLYTLNWSPDGNWFVATIHGGLGFRHAILAIEANGDKVFDLNLGGCRPNVSPDGKKICWGHGDYSAGVADLDLSGPIPRASNIMRRRSEPGPGRNVPRHLVAGHEVHHLHQRPEAQGQESSAACCRSFPASTLRAGTCAWPMRRRRTAGSPSPATANRASSPAGSWSAGRTRAAIDRRPESHAAGPLHPSPRVTFPREPWGLRVLSSPLVCSAWAARATRAIPPGPANPTKRPPTA